MRDYKKLKKIELFDYPNCGYSDTKNMHFRSFNQYLKEGCTVSECVHGQFYYGFDDFIDENGMEKFVAMLCGMLFMIEHNEVEPNLAYEVNGDIQDFETGEYDRLFTPDDLKIIYEDVEKIKDYLLQHPEILND